MPSSIASGSQAATVGTEHNLGEEITTAGTYVLAVNTGAMVAGDVLELRIYTRVKAGAPLALAYVVSFANVQGVLNKYSVPVPITSGMQCTLKQVGGTGRAFDWEIMAL